MRTTIGVIGALVLGIAVGALSVRSTSAARLESVFRERDALGAELAEVKAAKQRALDQVASLKKANESLQAEVDEPQEKPASPDVGADLAMALQRIADELPRESVAVPQQSTPSPKAEEHRDPSRDQRQSRRRPTGMSDEERAARQRQWQEALEQRRTQRAEFFAQAAAGTPDKEAQQRIAAIQEYSEYLRGLRDSLRQAENEEERDALRENIADNAQALRDLVETQQDYMLRQMASEYGITDQTQQDAFVKSFRNLESNPFFGEQNRWGATGRRGPRTPGIPASPVGPAGPGRPQ